MWQVKVTQLCAYIYICTYIYVVCVYIYIYIWDSLVAQTVKNLPAMWETRVQSLGWDSLLQSLEKRIATHSNYSCLKNSMGGGTWKATVHGAADSDTTKWPTHTHTHTHICVYMGFPGGATGKEPICQCRGCKRCRFDPQVGEIPWRRAWQPTPVFLPGESPMDLVGYGL